MNKTQAAQFIENVQGTIIVGDDWKTVELVAPNGRVQDKGIIDLDADPKEWGKAAKDKLMTQRTGDGRTLREWPEIFSSIYGEGQWKVRIHA